MLTFDDVKSFLTEVLTAKEYSPIPVIDPGPTNDPSKAKVATQMAVWVSIGNGAGLTTESMFDRPFITIRVAGKQNDFVSAEKLALDIDYAMLSVGSNTLVGNTKVLYFTRTGGRPELLELDKADRSIFQCSYITESPTGI